jgi:protein TonB
MRTSTLLLLATSSASLLGSALPAQAECDPRVVTSPTRFPVQAQERAQEGVVFLEVKVDASGRVSETRLLRSSGFNRLDRAAAASVRNEWLFDVSNCARKDLPASDLISVEYRYEPAKSRGIFTSPRFVTTTKGYVSERKLADERSR